MTDYQKFKELHYQKKPLLIANVWNAHSAKIFEKLGFQAIGTSSAAVAHSLGYEDGGQMPFTDLMFVVERIKKSTSIPLTVDLEFGYGNNAAEVANNIIDLQKIGVVGINIEDSVIEGSMRKLKNSDSFSGFLSDLTSILKQKGVSMFINVRCDAFLLQVSHAREEASIRTKQYEQAGADGIFLPCITEIPDIEALVSQTKLPINVMCMPNLPNFNTLETIGVKRISMGNSVHAYAYRGLEKIAAQVLEEQSFNPVF